VSEITLPIYASLDQRKLTGPNGTGSPTLPNFYQGDEVTCQLRLYETDDNGDTSEKVPTVRAIKVSLGFLEAPPTSGAFQLTVAGTDSTSIDFASSAAVFQAAIPNFGDVFSTCTSALPGLWVLQTKTASTAECPTIAVKANSLDPISFVRLRAFTDNDVWWFEIRLIQTQLAYTNAFDRILPPPPTVTRVVAGGSDSGNPAITINEIQQFTLPDDFRGTYVLTWNYRQTDVLGIDDGPDEVAAALNAMWSDGKTRFQVTNPSAATGYIEFVGPLANASWPLIIPVVKSTEPGVLTFTLSLKRPELAAALRNSLNTKGTPNGFVTAPLEISLDCIPDGEDITDLTIPSKKITIFQQSFTVNATQNSDETDTLTTPDWLNPPVPRDYIPFTPDQIITGVQTYVAAFGDGAARSFAFAHNLGTANLNPNIRQNIAHGRLLVNGTDYVITYGDAPENQLIVSIPDGQPTPAAGALVLSLATAGPVSAFQAHTHTIEQVVGLLDALNALGARIGALEDLVPTTPLSNADSTSSNPTYEIAIADSSRLYPARLPSGFDPSTALNAATKLPRLAYLLPAIHTNVVGAFDGTLPALPDGAGKVFQNGNSPLILPGVNGLPEMCIPAQSYFGCDGRIFYAVNNTPGTNSYFPAAFEDFLFMIPVNEKMLRAGQSLALDFTLALATVRASSRVQLVMVLEVGTFGADVNPVLVAPNLKDVEWNATPILALPLMLSNQPVTHEFGANIVRAADGTFTCSRQAYGIWEGGAQIPTAPNFALRARLIEFDTENNAQNARGFIYRALTKASATITQ